MAKDPQFGVPITPSEASLGLPFYPMYGVTPSDEYIPLQITADGKLATTATLTGSITIGEIGAPDETPFIYGTTLEQTIGGVYQDASPTLSAGQAGAVRLTEYRAFHSNLRDSSGNELLGQNASADSIPVVLASDQSSIDISLVGSSTSVTTSIAQSATNIEFLALNASRKGATIYNTSTNQIYLKLGTIASSTSFTVILMSQGYYEVPFNYLGEIDGVWDSAGAGTALVTELS